MAVRRLFFDIETSPNIGTFWTAGYKLNISYENILKERAIICICYKWEGEKKVHSLTWDAKQNDKKMLAAFMKVAAEADELIGHNGDKYDLAWIRTRCIFHGIECFPSYTTIDTLKVAKSKFRFNSNKLDYIAKYLGVGKKISTGGFGLWTSILLHKCPDAMKKMVKYCCGDVVILEKVFNKMSSHIAPKTHAGMKAGKGRNSCPECGSTSLVINQTKYSAAGVKKYAVKCKDCHKQHTIPATAYDKGRV